MARERFLTISGETDRAGYEREQDARCDPFLFAEYGPNSWHHFLGEKPLIPLSCIICTFDMQLHLESTVDHKHHDHALHIRRRFVYYCLCKQLISFRQKV